MSSEAFIKTVGLPQLTSEMANDREQFETWMEDLHSYAGYKNFLEALTVNTALPAVRVDPDTMPVSNAGEIAAKKAVKCNDQAMVYLNASVRGGRPRACILKTKTADYPCGIAHESVTNLKAKFAKVDAFVATELRTRLSKVKMMKREHPSVFFDKITVIKEIADKLTADQLTLSEYMAQVFKGTLAEYRQGLRDTKNRHAGALTLDHMEDEVLDLYRLHKLGEEDEEEADETALSTPGAGWSNGNFLGECYNCHKKGHRAHECPEKKQGRGGNSKGKRTKKKCRRCNRAGHLEAACWEDENNAAKRPNGWTSREVTSVTAGSNNTQGSAQDEFMLMTVESMKFPDSMKLLTDPNIWIADTGATTDSTGYEWGVIQTKKGDENDDIVDASGKTMKSSIIGNLPVTKIDCAGKEEGNMTLQDVSVVPTGKYNLFSVTKRLKNGWTMQGDTEALTLSKGKNQVRFDIILNSDKGRLYCGYFKRRIPSMGAGEGLHHNNY